MTAAAFDTLSLVAIILALLLAAVAVLAAFIRRTTPPVAFDKNCELRHMGVGEDRHFLIALADRPAWFAGVLVTLGLLMLFGWLAPRDEAARRADAAPHAQRLDRLLAVTHCRPPNLPLEKLVLAIASQADGRPPVVSCVYVRADLGITPKLRHERPLTAAAR